MVAVTSPSARDGRTTLAVDLAATLAESGSNVVLVDGDLRGSSLAERLPLSGPAAKPPQRAGSAPRSPARTPWSRPSIPDVPLGHHRVAFLPTGPIPSRPGRAVGQRPGDGPARRAGRRLRLRHHRHPAVGRSTTTARSSRRCRTARCWWPASAARPVPPCGGRCRRCRGARGPHRHRRHVRAGASQALNRTKRSAPSAAEAARGRAVRRPPRRSRTAHQGRRRRGAGRFGRHPADAHGPGTGPANGAGASRHRRPSHIGSAPRRLHAGAAGAACCVRAPAAGAGVARLRRGGRSFRRRT